MVIALALLVGSAIVGCLVPVRLRRLRDTHVDPRSLIVGWLLSIVGVIATATAGVTLLLVPGHGVPGGLFTAVRGCWMALRHGSALETEQFAGLAGWAVVAALAVRFAVIARREGRRRAHARCERLTALRMAGRTDVGSPAVLWLDYDRPLAFSLAGRPGLVVATAGLSRHLTPDQLGAVLEHERAHLRGHHHVLVAGVDALRCALPFLPLFRQAPGALRELVELSADAAAVRRYGAGALHSALLRVADHDVPDTALAAGRDAVDLRLRHLAREPRLLTPARRALRCVGVGAAYLSLPLLSGVGLLLTATLFCPLI